MKTFLTTLIFLLGSLAGVASAQQVQPLPVGVLVSLGEVGPDKSTEWRTEACEDIHALANDIVAVGVQVTCRPFVPLHLIDTYLQQLKANNAYHIRILRGFKGSFRVTVTNWNKTLESDFTTLGWSISRELHTTPRRMEALKNVLGNLFDYVQREEELKKMWLLNARNFSNTISYDLKELSFKAVKDRKKISVTQAARLFEAESVENSQYLHTMAELAVGYSTTTIDELNFLNPESSLNGILTKAALQARKAADPWSELISIDLREISEDTVELVEASPAQERTTSAIFAPERKTPTKRKAPGRLIILFGN